MTFDPSLSEAIAIPVPPKPLKKVSIDVFFEPHSIAVIGASERQGTVGRTLVHNLLSGPFAEKLIPVNPNRETVLGVRAYSSISQAPIPVDLAIIATPAP